MRTAKQDAAAIINSLPEDASLEEIQYRLYVLEKIRSGLAEIDAGRDLSHEEALVRLAKWRDG
jgi:predicted transcriptional regulator